MNLDEWYLEYERLMQHHALAMRKLSRQLPAALSSTTQEISTDGIVASTNKPDVPGQKRLNLHDPLDLIV